MSYDTSRKPAKYDPNNQLWYGTDLFPNCTKPVIVCIQCGHPGHISINLNQNIGRWINDVYKVQVIKYIHHSHFTHETDRGRHVRCEIARLFIDPQQACDRVWQMKSREMMPQWLRLQLYGEDQ